jgi:hypothetical protein
VGDAGLGWCVGGGRSCGRLGEGDRSNKAEQKAQRLRVGPGLKLGLELPHGR